MSQNDHEPTSRAVSEDDADTTSRRRALGAGIGLAVVLATYAPAGLGDVGRWWAAGATIVLAVLLVDILGELKRLLPVPGVAPLTMIAALFAIYLCVPETGQVPVAAFVPVSIVGMEVVSRRQVGIEWYAVAAASVGWAGLFGTSGRPSALIGAIFAWWAVVLVPLVHVVRPLPSKVSALVVAIIGVIAVAVMARTGGVAETAAAAWLAALLIAAMSFGLSILVAELSRRDKSDPVGH